MTWWTNKSCGGKSSGAFTWSSVWALNSASSSVSFSSVRSQILQTESKKYEFNQIYPYFCADLYCTWSYHKLSKLFLRELMIGRSDCQCRLLMRTPLDGCDWVFMVSKMCNHSISILPSEGLNVSGRSASRTEYYYAKLLIWRRKEDSGQNQSWKTILFFARKYIPIHSSRSLPMWNDIGTTYAIWTLHLTLSCDRTLTTPTRALALNASYKIVNSGTSTRNHDKTSILTPSNICYSHIT